MSIKFEFQHHFARVTSPCSLTCSVSPSGFYCNPLELQNLTFYFPFLLFCHKRRQNVVMHHRPYSYLYFILHTHKHQDRVWSPIYHSYLIAASHLFVTYNPIHRNATLHICFRSFIVFNLMVSAKPHATYYLIQLTSIDINMYSVQ